MSKKQTDVQLKAIDSHAQLLTIHSRPEAEQPFAYSVGRYGSRFLAEIRDNGQFVGVRCPKCKSEGPLMDEFSYLCGGFNGIKVGDEDDLDAQECGRCAAKMEWAHIPGYEKIVKI